MAQVSFETYVKGGLPVVCNAEIDPPDPSVGCFHHDIADLWLEVRGKPAPWAEKGLSKADRDRLEEEALAAYFDTDY